MKKIQLRTSGRLMESVERNKSPHEMLNIYNPWNPRPCGKYIIPGIPGHALWLEKFIYVSAADWVIVYVTLPGDVWKGMGEEYPAADQWETAGKC